MAGGEPPKRKLSDWINMPNDYEDSTFKENLFRQPGAKRMSDLSTPGSKRVKRRETSPLNEAGKDRSLTN